MDFGRLSVAMGWNFSFDCLYLFQIENSFLKDKMPVCCPLTSLFGALILRCLHGQPHAEVSAFTDSVLRMVTARAI